MDLIWLRIRKFKRWKASLKQFCNLPAQQDCSIEDDFSYLVSKGLLSIGNYDTQIAILEIVDTAAEHYAIQVVHGEKKSTGRLYFQKKYLIALWDILCLYMRFWKNAKE